MCFYWGVMLHNAVEMEGMKGGSSIDIARDEGAPCMLALMRAQAATFLHEQLPRCCPQQGAFLALLAQQGVNAPRLLFILLLAACLQKGCKK